MHALLIPLTQGLRGNFDHEYRSHSQHIVYFLIKRSHRWPVQPALLPLPVPRPVVRRRRRVRLQARVPGAGQGMQGRDGGEAKNDG